jgi:hypothetical protein
VALFLVYAVFAAIDAAFGGNLLRTLRWGGVAVGGTLAIVLLGVWAC